VRFTVVGGDLTLLGDLVRAHRRRLSLSQEELATRAALSVRTVRDVELGRIGRPRPDTVRRLADTLRLSDDDRDALFDAAAAAWDTADANGGSAGTTVADRAARAEVSASLRGRAAGRRGRPVVPAQLPADVAGFTGRVAALAQLDALLARWDGFRGGAAAAVQPSAAVVISAVSGTAGVGKTALAVHWAHRVVDRFPDGQLYVNLRGFDPGGRMMTPAEAVRGFLDALGVPPPRIPTDLDTQAGLYRSLLAGTRTLVVLDNASDVEQVRMLLPGSATCLALVTSRNQLTGLVAAEAAHPLTLDLLDADEARQLLVGRLGADRVAAEPDAVEQIITACARLPLALAVAAARAQQTGFPLAAISTELADARQRLDALDTGDPAGQVRAVFSWSYQALTSPTARLFRLLGLHPGPDISAPATASLAGIPLPQARPLLAELARASLIVEHQPGRYTLHDLLHAYANSLTHRLDPETERRTATHRLFDHYLHTGHAATVLLRPGDPIPLTPPRPGVGPEALADHQQALTWFTAEHRVLLAAVHHAAATGFDTHTWQLAWTLDDFLDWRGLWHDYATAQLTALAAAERLADPTAQAHTHRLLGRVYISLGRFDDALTHLQRALDLHRQIDDRAGQAWAHNCLAVMCHEQSRDADALDHTEQALDLFRAAGHRPGEATALNNIGWYHGRLGDHQQALTSCRQALTLFQKYGSRYGQASAWDSLGYAHHNLGQHAQAITCYQHALDLLQGLGDRYEKSNTLTRLGDTHHATGNHTAAHHTWQHALDILTDLDHPKADTVRTKLASVRGQADPDGQQPSLTSPRP
jgi:tetratricopeptide (TPR) repeat protein/transcriptional regulator with XRE-family HTH domain